MSSLIELPEPLPVLRNPFLVMHLGGWSDAGLAGEGAAVFLGARWPPSTPTNCSTTAPAGRWCA